MTGLSANGHGRFALGRGAKVAYEENLTRGNSRVTAQPQSRPGRATSWLANWVDYAFAVILVVGRLFRVPGRKAEAAAQHSYAAAVIGADSYRPRWHDQAEPEPQQHWIVRPAEILMLSISFFLAAHLLGGGTAEVRAPQVNPLSFLSNPTPQAQVRASSVPATGGLIVEFVSEPVRGAEAQTVTTDAGVAVDTSGVEETAPAALEDPQPAPPEPDGQPAAAGLTEPTPTATPTQPPAPTPTPEPTQAAAEPTPAAPTPAPTSAPAPGPSVLSYSAIYDLALQAGWPADRADQVARVAFCESRYRPGAIGYGTYGLMQLVPLWFSASGTDFELWSDPLTNLRVALYAFETDMSYGNDPWAPWSCKPWNITLP